MRNFYLIVFVVFGLYSCEKDTDIELSEMKSIELISKNSSRNVQLLRAWSSNESSPVQQKHLRRFTVKVKNIAYEKEVIVHHLTVNGNWIDIPLSYQQSITDDYEIWEGEVEPSNQLYGEEFAIKYSTNGNTYWDNNEGNNYSMPVSIGAYLASDIQISLDPYYTRFANNYLAINLDVRHVYGANITNVEVVYSTDGWQTEQRNQLNYYRYFRVGYSEYIISPNQYDIDKYGTSIRFTTNVDKVEFAVVYTVNGQEYWDNNYENNYTLHSVAYKTVNK